MSRRTTSRSRCLLVAVICCLTTPFLYGQTASITGTIKDDSGASVPDARVTVESLDKGGERSTSSDTQGFYSVTNLLVGRYSVSVQKTGFRTLTFQNVSLTVADNLNLSGALSIGALSQTIEVFGSAVRTMNHEDAQLSDLVDSRRITELPLITRDPYSLVLLSPGAQLTNSSLGGFSINGQRDRNNNFLLDGVDNNDASVPGLAGGISTLNPDATQEFRVITNNFLPEFGRNTGAIVDIVTRSGSNEFHGTVYEFNRIKALAARDYFNPKPDPQNPFTRNQFGASLGGPLVKDKTFFFVNGEWDRFRTTVSNNSIVPSAAFKTGKFTYGGQPIDLADPASPTNLLGIGLDPRMQKIFSLYPNPNGPAVDDIRGIYFFPTSLPVNSANTTFRLDHRINERYSFFARYIYNGLTSGNSTNEVLPGLGGLATNQQNHNGAFNFIAALRPDVVNEFRFGLNKADVPFTCNGRNVFDQNSSLDPFGAGNDYRFNTSLGIQTIANFGCGSLNDSNSQQRTTGTWNWVDQVSWVKGGHAIKFGGEFRYVFDNNYDANASRPAVDFTVFGRLGVPVVDCAGSCATDETLQTMSAALLGMIGEQSQTQYFNAQGARTPVDYRSFIQHEYALYLQDQWKIRSNLTLEAGLRYEYNGVPFERHGNLSNLLYQQPSDGSPLTFQTVGPGTGRNMYFGDPYNFEPRLGLAWDPFHDGKTSVRLGYGIFHDRAFGSLIGGLRASPPFVAGITSFPDFDYLSGLAPAVTPTNLASPGTAAAPSATVANGDQLMGLTILNRDLRTPYTQSWNVGIQRELVSKLTLEVNYVGSTSHRQYRIVDGNPPQPSLVAAAQASGALPVTVSGNPLRQWDFWGYPQLTGNTALSEPVVVKSIGNATYNALQAVFRKQFEHGLQFQAGYTWSHAIDDSSDPLTPTLDNRTIARNSFDLHEERGSSDFDLRHRLTLSFVYDLPFGRGHLRLNRGIAAATLGGWEVSGLSTFQSGTPFSIYSGLDSEYTGLTNRPDLVGNPAIPANAPRNETGPPITAFAEQPLGRPGNVGRNLFTGPTYINTDVSLLKSAHLSERISLQFRAEVFNVFNTVQFLQPEGNSLSDPGTFGLSEATRGQPDGTTSARQIQLALKVVF